MDFVLQRNPERNNMFLPIEVGPIKASIQASRTHYCSPRETLPSSDDYQSFEVALFLNDEWFHPEQDNRFANCSWASYWSSSDDVAGRVPREEISQMLIDLGSAF